MNENVTKTKKTHLKSYFKNAYKYRFLVQEIVRKNIKLQYRNSFLGMFWTFLQPLFTMIVLVLIFSRVFGKSDSGVVCYPIYVLCGRLIYECFSQSTKRAMRSIRNSASVIKKVYVPKYIYPLSNVLANFITFLISLSVLVVVFAFFYLFQREAMYPDLVLSWKFLLIIVPIILLFLLSLGCGMILSVLNVFFKDIEYIYEVFCMLLFYITPVFYSLDTLNLGGNGWFAYVLKANPLYWIVDLTRCCVLPAGFEWNWTGFIYTLAFSVVSILIGVFFFFKKQDKFILHI